MMLDNSEGHIVREPLLLDPFAFHGHTASVIKGVGGTVPNADPSYAFHTDYVRLARGRAHYTVRFGKLQAKRGTLVLRVHILPDAPGAHASMVTSARIQLNRLVQIGGEIEIAFEALRDVTYALMGLVAGETDAIAEDITIAAYRQFDEAEDRLANPESGTPTVLGHRGFRGTSHIVSLAAPALDIPVSQVATDEQLANPIFAEWRDRLHIASGNALDDWSAIFLSQAMRSYGLLGEARGRSLLVGPIPPLLIELLLSLGWDVTMLDRGERPPLPDKVDYRGFDNFEASVPRDLYDFDFVGSCALGARLGEKEPTAALMLSLMRSLRPQGIAINVLGTGTRTPGFKRADLERLALDFLSYGHDVSQLRLQPYRSDTDRSPGAFGMIARRTPRWL